MEPSAIWPPPIYIRENIGPQERYYVEHRWFAQWAWYDARATFYKKRYQRIQLGIGIGAVAVPVLVGVSGFDPMTDTALKIATVVISLMVAALTAWENVYKHGENWRLFRAAAEDLSREKSMYDMQAGPYLRAEQPFVRFVERCEVIMAQQNGRWLQQYQQDEKTISD
jgi:hypothetical protein